jgi:uracil-DNA glycosylase
MELNPSWNVYFNNLKIKETYQKIKDESDGKEIFPPINQVLNAFSLFEPDKLKVIIIGQDPYHKIGQANGFSFSIQPDMRIPPSLKNIFKELKADIGCELSKHGDLTSWAEQGVLLLNSALTVYEGEPNSNRKLWEPITDTLIKRISSKIPNLVFILWGGNAINKKKVITNVELNNHLILEGGHPSPLNRHIKKNFYGQKFFSKTNKYLIENEKEPIEWDL